VEGGVQAVDEARERAPRPTGASPVKLWSLKLNRVLGRLPEADLRAWSGRIMCEHTYLKQELIYSAHEPGDTVYILKEGRVRLYRLAEDGRELTVAILDSGDVFGEDAVARPQARTTFAEALDDVVVCVMRRDDFLELLRRRPEAAEEVVRVLGERLERAQGQGERIAYRSVPARLASWLLEEAATHGEPAPDGVRIRHRLTHQQIASLLGTTRETLTTTLNRMIDEGLLAAGRQELIIRNEAALRARARE
jgi:CRP-like cAMP-binding protein